jgi:hypothetical protein
VTDSLIIVYAIGKDSNLKDYTAAEYRPHGDVVKTTTTADVAALLLYYFVVKGGAGGRC